MLFLVFRHVQSYKTLKPEKKNKQQYWQDKQETTTLEDNKFNENKKEKENYTFWKSSHILKHCVTYIATNH